MTPDADDPRDDWLTVDEKLSVHADDTEHHALAENAVEQITTYLARVDPHPGSHDFTVYGTPPTLSLTLSVIAAHWLIDAIKAADELAAVRKIVDEAITTCGLGATIADHFGRNLD